MSVGLVVYVNRVIFFLYVEICSVSPGYEKFQAELNDLFFIDEIHLRALIVTPHYEQRQENIIYFKAHYILDNCIFSITSEKRLKFPIISASSPRHSNYDIRLLKGITN